MINVRAYIAEGLAQRASAGIKVRQPLGTLYLPKVDEKYYDIIKDELNIKTLVESKNKLVDLDTKITDELRQEGLMRELVRHIQSARKEAGLKVADRIHLHIESDSKEIVTAALNFKDTIFAETLATGDLTDEGSFFENVEVGGHQTKITLKKA